MKINPLLIRLLLLIFVSQGMYAQESATLDLGTESTIRPAKGHVVINNHQIPVLGGVNEVHVTTYADGRIHLMYNTSFKDMALADKHFAKLAKVYENKNIFGINIPRLQKTPPYGYSFELCNAQLDMHGNVGSVKISVDILGHGYGAYVFIDNFCQ